MKIEQYKDLVSEPDKRLYYEQYTHNGCVSVFENYFAKKPIGETTLEKWLLTDRFKDEVEAYRNETDPAIMEKMKQRMPCITPAGRFGCRDIESLKQLNGFACVDIDRKYNDFTDWEAVKKLVAQNFDSLYYAGLSLSGDGVNLIFKMKSHTLHPEFYMSLMLHLESIGVSPDKSCRATNKLRCASYDPNSYFNPDAEKFARGMGWMGSSAAGTGFIQTTTIYDNPYTEHHSKTNVESCLKAIGDRGIDITDKYQHWFKIGCSLAREFGEKGRYYFHKVSRHHVKYDPIDCDIQYNKCLVDYKRCSCTLGTFFHHCKQKGINSRGEYQRP